MSNDENCTPKEVETTDTQLSLIPPPSSRENLVVTAIKFLSNPKVHSNSYESKRSFLLQKGLSEEEIEMAFLKLSHVANPSTIESSWTETGYSFVLLGVVCFGVYKFLNQFINQVILGKKDETIVALENNVREINESLSNMQSSLTTVTQKLLEMPTPDKTDEEQQMQAVVLNELKVKMNDLSSEVSSIKSILLSRHQFPATPLINPTIPTWQLKENSNSAEDSQKEDNNNESEKETDGEEVVIADETVQKNGIEHAEDSLTAIEEIEE